MSHDELLNTCTAIISEVMKVDPSYVTPDTSLIHDLGADSLDMLNLIVKVEERLAVRLSDKDLVQEGMDGTPRIIDTVRDLLDLLDRKLRQRVVAET